MRIPAVSLAMVSPDPTSVHELDLETAILLPLKVPWPVDKVLEGEASGQTFSHGCRSPARQGCSVPFFVSAQSKYAISPAAFSSSHAGDGAALWTTHAPCTYMQIHRDLGTQVMLIKEMSFRRYRYPRSYAAFSASISLSLSTASASAPSATYASNHGANRTNIFFVTSPKTINFPTTDYQTAPVFEYHIPFPGSTTFFQVPSTSLCWELRVHSTTATISTWMDLDLTFMGGWGCYIYTEPAVPLGGVTTAQGTVPTYFTPQGLPRGLTEAL